MATDRAIEGKGRAYMAIADEAGRIHLVDLDVVRLVAAELEREGVDVAGMRADLAARAVLTRIQRDRGELLN